MNREIAVQLLRRMVEIPSISGQEEALAEYLVGSMEQFGLYSHIDEVGNAVGEWENANGPLIMLLGHMDTVPGLIAVRQESSLLYGRGTVDAKGPLAAFICAAAALRHVSGRFIVVGAVEEETSSSRGAHFLLDRYRPDIVLIGEPSGWSNVVLGYKGRIQLNYSVTRPGSHSAGPGDTAAEAGVAFWNQLVQHLTALGGEKSMFHCPTASLLRFDGSDRQAHLEISCRIPPGFDADAFQQFLAGISGDDQLHLEEITPAVVMERTNPAAQALVRAIRQHDGRPKLKLKTGTSDMNIVSQHWHVPMVAYGPGDSILDHTDHEHVDINEYLRAIDVLTDALRMLVSELATSHFAAQEQHTNEQIEQRPEAEASFPADTEAVNLVVEMGRAASSSADLTYAPEEEEELSKRLQALGYLE